MPATRWPAPWPAPSPTTPAAIWSARGWRCSPASAVRMAEVWRITLTGRRATSICSPASSVDVLAVARASGAFAHLAGDGLPTSTRPPAAPPAAEAELTARLTAAGYRVVDASGRESRGRRLCRAAGCPRAERARRRRRCDPHGEAVSEQPAGGTTTARARDGENARRNRQRWRRRRRWRPSARVGTGRPQAVRQAAAQLADLLIQSYCCLCLAMLAGVGDLLARGFADAVAFECAGRAAGRGAAALV